MKLTNLLVSNVSISEEAYSSENSFTLSDQNNNTLSLNVMELEVEQTLKSIKEKFSISEDISVIKSYIMTKITELASLGISTKQGENYQEETKNSHEKEIESLDMA